MKPSPLGLNQSVPLRARMIYDFKDMRARVETILYIGPKTENLPIVLIAKGKLLIAQLVADLNLF